MSDNITNYSPSFVTTPLPCGPLSDKEGFISLPREDEALAEGKAGGGSSALELLEKDIAKIATQEVTAHPEWDEILARLDKCFIDRDTHLIEQKHLMEIHGVKCFPRGDLIAISGKEKCGKTTACRILSTILLKGEYEGFKAQEKNLRILWVDTEQARVSTRTVSRAIDMMCGFLPTSDQIRFLNLREWGDKASMRLVLQVMFDTYCPDFVILDGIRDFIDDFNDVRESAEIVLEVMRLSSGVSADEAKEKKLQERMPCSIVCILHQNKPKDDNNMRGHLGTELANKAGEVWESTRDDDGLFKFTQTRSRTRPLEEPICFKVRSKNYVDQTGRVEEIGIPEIWKDINKSVVEQSGPMISTSLGTHPKNANTALWLFWKLMNGRSWKYDNLKQEFCKQFGVSVFIFNELKELAGSNVFKDDIDCLWHYQGPSFSEDE